MSAPFEFAAVDRFTAAAIGEPGRRLFVLQIEAENQTITMKVEKQQVSTLARYLGELLVDLARPGHLPEDLEPRGPIDIAWAIGSIAVTYDEALDRLIVVFESAPSDHDPDPKELRAAITREQAAAFSITATALVEAGRPPCPLCGHPLDPSGHACPRTNGHRPPEL